MITTLRPDKKLLKMDHRILLVMAKVSEDYMRIVFRLDALFHELELP